MNRGVIIGNSITLISKIVLKYTKKCVKFSCHTPIFMEGSIMQNNTYTFNLLVPKILFNESSIESFHGTKCKGNIRIKICDVLDPSKKLYILLPINKRENKHCGMISLTATVCSDVVICNPIMFICGNIIHNDVPIGCGDFNFENNNVCGIQLFITNYNDGCECKN